MYFMLLIGMQIDENYFGGQFDNGYYCLKYVYSLTLPLLEMNPVKI